MKPNCSAIRRFRGAQHVRINYTALAKRLHVTPQAIRRVALGLSKSARITAAIERELQTELRRLGRAA